MAQCLGKVVWFNNAKGYGFVTHEGGADVFCHFSSIQAEGYKALKEGAEVEFDIENGPQGRPQTANLRAVPVAATV
jgi:CspA family cold shock protein